MCSDYFAVRKAFSRALEGGATRHSLTHATWDVSGGCTDRQHRELHAHPPSQSGEVRVDRNTRTPFHLELWLRCRKCDNCLRQRQREWTAKAIFECRNSIRTWFGTLTLRPERHYHTLATAREMYASSGDFDALAYNAQFARRCSVIGKEITRYVKRLRKQSDSSLRTLFVAEHHKSGLPHYHCLIHERDLQGTSEEMLREQWTWGFTNWKLLRDPVGAAYACKYLSKSGASRVRASIGYGKTSLDIAKAFETRSVKTNDPPNPSLDFADRRDAAGVGSASWSERQEGIGWTRTTGTSESVREPQSVL